MRELFVVRVSRTNDSPGLFRDTLSTNDESKSSRRFFSASTETRSQ